MANLEDVCWDSSCVRTENAAGQVLRTVSLTYNASISALEVRALRPDDAETYLQTLGRGPMVIRLEHSSLPSETHVIHFEDARLAFPVECNGEGALLSVFVLRGLRFERK